jgi:Ca-activated chloride channel family protein
MTFAWPYMLALLALPLTLVILGRARRRESRETHPKILRAKAGERFLNLEAGPPRAPIRRPMGWVAAGLALGIVALARPQWGQIEEPATERAREILVALDLSRSMLTPDVAPSRLERAKLLVLSLLDRLEREHVGLEVFAGTAFLQAPLSIDYEIVREMLPYDTPRTMPVGGTNYGAMIDSATAAFSGVQGAETQADRFLIVLSDGGATDDNWREHLPKLQALGIHVIGLGLGSQAGGLIPDGAGGFVKDSSGAVVQSRLEGDNLRELADRTGGVYRDASGPIDLPELLRSTIEAGRQGRFQEKVHIRRIERFQWALAPAWICLVIAFWREFPARPKPRAIRPQQSKPSQAKGAMPAAAAAILVLLAAVFRAGAATEPSSNDPGAPLSRTVGRLSQQDRQNSRDWVELGRDTVDWGQRLQAGQKEIPAGPVQDALAGVDAGSAKDPALTDWNALRSQLEALELKPPEKKQPPPQSQQNQQQGQNEQQQQQQQNGSSQPSAGEPPPESGLGGMQPPPPQNRAGEEQSLGGAPKQNHADPARNDPSLAEPLARLQQVRDHDSPAELLRMMQKNQPQPQQTQGKDW